MGSGRLTALQGQVVEILQDFDPAWTFTGGGALAAVHLQHQATRDLDLFWHGRRLLDRLPEVSCFAEVRRAIDSGMQALKPEGAGYHGRVFNRTRGWRLLD